MCNNKNIIENILIINWKKWIFILIYNKFFLIFDNSCKTKFNNIFIQDIYIIV